jgi:hypothetical protein
LTFPSRSGMAVVQNKLSSLAEVVFDGNRIVVSEKLA